MKRMRAATVSSIGERSAALAEHKPRTDARKRGLWFAGIHCVTTVKVTRTEKAGSAISRVLLEPEFTGTDRKEQEIEMSYKTYIGKRLSRRPGDVTVEVQTVHTDGSIITLPLTHRKYHSPTGFEWGYCGSGPADLALAIMLDYFSEEPTEQEIKDGAVLAAVVYKQFKNEFVAGFPKNGFRLEHNDIEIWLAKQPDVMERVKKHNEYLEEYRQWQLEGAV